MLLIHGPGAGGVHLFWLDAGGYHKSAHVPADSFPAHVLKMDGDTITVLFSADGKERFHQMLWWGP